MSEIIRSYPKAPIQEAILDIRTERAYSRGIQEKFTRKLKAKYPAISPQMNFSVTVDPGQEKNSKIVHEVAGFRMASNDQADVVLIGNNNIATARLAPRHGKALSWV